MSETLNTPQPTPVHEADAGPECWAMLLHDYGARLPSALVDLMRERDEMGRAKYGVPLRVWDGRDAVADALQEALDLVVYLQRALMRVPETDPREWRPYDTHDRLFILRNDALGIARSLLALAEKVPKERP